MVSMTLILLLPPLRNWLMVDTSDVAPNSVESRASPFLLERATALPVWPGNCATYGWNDSALAGEPNAGIDVFPS